MHLSQKQKEGRETDKKTKAYIEGERSTGSLAHKIIIKPYATIATYMLCKTYV